MDYVLAGIKVLVATVGGTIAFVLGGVDFLLKALILLMVLDYLSGVLNAIHQGKVSSQIGFKGIAKKVFLLIVVAVAFVIESILNNSLPLREVVIMFFVANEGISILENAVCMGIEVPEVLKKVLIQVKCKDQKEDKEDQNEKELEE